ncbi:hypothetical protein C0J52_11268 [Blattella germanica]|nr:hypothetical protein C0J52_11268 [Blattella germanica]
MRDGGGAVTTMLVSRGGGGPPNKLATRPLPPPPVPPRPSKALVAEALARTRNNVCKDKAVPIRRAPPPPVPKERTPEPVHQSLKNESGDCAYLRSGDESSVDAHNDGGEEFRKALNDSRSELQDVSEKTDIGSRFDSEERLLLAKLKDEKQEGSVKVVQSTFFSSKRTLVFNGGDEYVRTTASDQDKQRMRRYAPHVLPTGQHKHDSCYASSGNRNTVLLIDNNPRPILPESLVEDLIVELQESSQLRNHSHFNNNNNRKADEKVANGVGPKQNNELIESYKNSQPRIQHSDWFEVDNGKPVRYSSCHITVEDSHTGTMSSSCTSNGDTESTCSTVDISRSNSFQYSNYSELSLDVNLNYRPDVLPSHPLYCNRRRNMASLQGLPPLPKSLSGINLFEGAGDLHFSPMDQQQKQQEATTPRGMTKSSSFRQLAPPPPPPQSSATGGGISAGSARAGPSVTSTRGPTPPTPGGTPHQQILHHQHLRTQQNGDAPPPIAPRMRKLTGLDAQLAILRKEMVSGKLPFTSSYVDCASVHKYKISHLESATQNFNCVNILVICFLDVVGSYGMC